MDLSNSAVFDFSAVRNMDWWYAAWRSVYFDCVDSRAFVEDERAGDHNLGVLCGEDDVVEELHVLEDDSVHLFELPYTLDHFFYVHVLVVDRDHAVLGDVYRAVHVLCHDMKFRVPDIFKKKKNKNI